MGRNHRHQVQPHDEVGLHGSDQVREGRPVADYYDHPRRIPRPGRGRAGLVPSPKETARPSPEVRAAQGNNNRWGPTMSSLQPGIETVNIDGLLRPYQVDDVTRLKAELMQ